MNESVNDTPTQVTDTISAESVRLVPPPPDRLVELLAARISQDQSRAVWLALLAPPGASVVPLYLGRFGPPRLAVELDNDRVVLKDIDCNRAHAAFVRDIGSFTTLDLAEQLGLHVSPEFEESGTRSGRRYVESGRKLLSELSASPWTLAGGGKLPDDWYLDRSYATRLADWHYGAVIGAFERTLTAARWASGAPISVGSSRAIRAANDAYFEPPRL